MENNNAIKTVQNAIGSDKRLNKSFVNSKQTMDSFCAFIVAAIRSVRMETENVVADTFRDMFSAYANRNATKPDDKTIASWFEIIRIGFKTDSVPNMPKRFVSYMELQTFSDVFNSGDLIPVKRDTAKHGQHGLKPKNNVNHRIATEMVDSHSVKLTAYVNNAIVGTLIVAFADYRNGFGLKTVADFYGNVYEMKSDQHRVLELINRLGCDSLREYYANEFIGYFVNRGSKRPDGTSFTGGAIRNLAGKCRPNTGK